MSIESDIKKAVAEVVEPLFADVAEMKRMLTEKRPPIDVKEKARRLGVSEETVRRRVRDGEIDCTRNGNRMLFPDV